MDSHFLTRCLLVGGVVATLFVEAPRVHAQVQEMDLVNALLLKGPIEALPQPGQIADPVRRFQSEVVRVAVPAARSLGVTFAPDGANSLMGYLASPPIASLLREPGTAPPAGQRDGNERRFVALLLAHADREKLQITAESVKRTQGAIDAIRPSGWFCPCWPFCK
jgi:hypothetical protein